MKIGYHINILSTKQKVLPEMTDGASQLLKSIQYAHINNHANCIQLFIGNPKSYSSISINNTSKIRKYVQDNNIFLVCHSPYILNFARPNNHNAVNRYISDLNNIYSMGGIGSVVHMGYNVLNDPDVNRTFIKNLDNVVDEIYQESSIIIENMSGKGTSMCCKLDEWATFNEELDENLSKRVSYCIDTAHLYGEGSYNLSMRREVMRFYEDFDNLIGWNKVNFFHFNGSNATLGSCADLHADIGDTFSGVIESKGLRHLARIAHQTQKPLILETPGNTFPILWQIETIKSWIDPYHPMHSIFGSTQFV
jgi:apurinic endonuclease APN1